MNMDEDAKNNPLRDLTKFGQSIWLDYTRRDLVTNGQLRRFIANDQVRGMTSNPSIFEKAIVGSWLYDREISAMAHEGRSPIAIYEALSQEDFQSAADEFRPVFEEMAGQDGYVSLEVNPHLAHDTNGTIAEARRLWRALDRPNVFIKVPATAAGVPAIEKLTAEGINVNVTLLFGLPRYQEVAAAYIAGLNARAAEGKPLKSIASVASFFVSRIDVLIDSILERKMAAGGKQAELARKLQGEVAIASAKTAYQLFKKTFESESFKPLADRGARVQRLLWASTSTKNPTYNDLKYMEALIGPNSIDTVTLEMLEAYRQHGVPKSRLEENSGESARILEQLHEIGIDLNQITQQLENEEVEKFNQAFDKLINALKQKAQQARSEQIQVEEGGSYVAQH
ncbi:MAG: transaldolase [Verrucomicrobiales bacterium]|nr:transaldolase [Verrucomicrobiales bacterium]